MKYILNLNSLSKYVPVYNFAFLITQGEKNISSEGLFFSLLKSVLKIDPAGKVRVKCI